MNVLTHEWEPEESIVIRNIRYPRHPSTAASMSITWKKVSSWPREYASNVATSTAWDRRFLKKKEAGST